ncbi:MAG: DUF86 domain-containing protein [Desulfatitalea sp.]
MFEAALLIEKLEQIQEALARVQRRFVGIEKVDIFLDSDEGLDKLDAICMMFLAVGESFKKIDAETKGAFLPCYPEINWKGVKGLRDVLSHHYFNIDAEEIFFICQNNLEPLQRIVEKMINDIKKGCAC